LASKDKEMKQVIAGARCAKSEQVKFEVSKSKEETKLCKTKSQSGCPLGLTRWQERKLKRLSSTKLKTKNMAWVPKKGPQSKVDVQVPVARIAARMKEEKTEAGKTSTLNSLHIIRSFGQHIVHITQLCHLYICHIAYPQV
jgi:hypothetical protein